MFFFGTSLAVQPYIKLISAFSFHRWGEGIKHDFDRLHLQFSVSPNIFLKTASASPALLKEVEAMPNVAADFLTRPKGHSLVAVTQVATGFWS